MDQVGASPLPGNHYKYWVRRKPIEVVLVFQKLCPVFSIMEPINLKVVKLFWESNGVVLCQLYYQKHDNQRNNKNYS